MNVRLTHRQWLCTQACWILDDGATSSLDKSDQPVTSAAADEPAQQTQLTAMKTCRVKASSKIFAIQMSKRQVWKTFLYFVFPFNHRDIKWKSWQMCLIIKLEDYHAVPTHCTYDWKIAHIQNWDLVCIFSSDGHWVCVHANDTSFEILCFVSFTVLM